LFSGPPHARPLKDCTMIAAAKGWTVRELARLLRISPDKIRWLIKAGRLDAVNTATRGKPRYVILPHHLDAFEQRHRAHTPQEPPPRRRRRKTDEEDFVGRWAAAGEI
jgi:excisionase family DNA binding protein